MNPNGSTTNGSGHSGSTAPVVLTILDGWGYREDREHNAIHHAETPVMDALWHAYPHALIEASGSDVGLPDNQMGNSEVGHLTIGAGRIIRQELVRISDTVRSNQLAVIPGLAELAERLKQSNGTLHLLGLCSDGGVHSHVEHLCGLIRWAKQAGISRLAIHAITDGRDTPTQSALGYLQTVQQTIAEQELGELSTLCGRYWAMDRDKRWERIEKAYNLYTDPETPTSALSVEELSLIHI